MSTDTKPCPFCGSQSVAVQPGSTFRWVFAECMECGASTGEERVQTSGSGAPAEWAADAEARAMAEWNRRADDESAALRQIISDCAAAVGNGTGVDPTCSLDFMRLLPGEIRAAVAPAPAPSGAAPADPRPHFEKWHASPNGRGGYAERGFYAGWNAHAALASREASPAPLTDAEVKRRTAIAFEATNDYSDGSLFQYWYAKGLREGAALASPQVAPAMTDERIKALMPAKSGLAPSNPEAVARGIVGAFRDVWTEPAMYAFARTIEREVLAAPVQVAPADWKLVPVEPTEAMFTRFAQQIETGVVYVGGFVQAYRCMLDATPAAPAQPGAAADDRVQGASTGKLIGFVSLESAERPMVSDPSTGPSWGSYSRQAFGEWNVPVYVQPGAAADGARDAAAFLQPADYAALARVGECLEDDEGYDVPAETMKRLAELGVVRRRTGSICSVTSFGNWLLGTWEVLPLQTTSDANVPPSTPAAKPAEEQGS